MKIKGIIDFPKSSNKDHWVIAQNESEAIEKIILKYPSCSIEDIELTQDEDVLDTWYSSGLLPFSVFGWPDDTNDLKSHFPTDVLETGHDIIFFWVARMVMMSLGLTNRLPFHTVYLHSIIKDKYGRKMSKSLGNVIDPIWVMEGRSLEYLIESLKVGNLDSKELKKASEGMKADYPKGIPECGADALRFGLLAYTLQGKTINLNVMRVSGYRQFCNKIWQTFRFSLNLFNSEFKLLSLD